MIYLYRYSYFCWNAPWTGVCHGDELFPLFGDPIRRPWLYNSTDVTYSQNLIDVWSKYTRQGSPPAQATYNWLAYQDPPPNTGVSSGIRPPSATSTPTDRPTWPSVLDLNPLKSQTGARYNAFRDCDQFWSRHMDIWMGDSTTRAKYRKMVSIGKQWTPEVYYHGVS